MTTDYLAIARETVKQRRVRALAVLKQASHRLPGIIDGRATVAIPRLADCREVREALKVIYPTCQVLYLEDPRVSEKYRQGRRLEGS